MKTIRKGKAITLSLAHHIATTRNWCLLRIMGAISIFNLTGDWCPLSKEDKEDIRKAVDLLKGIKNRWESNYFQFLTDEKIIKAYETKRYY